MRMKRQLDSVAEFHKAFKQKDGRWPQPLDIEDFELRHRLMEEENNEYLEACDRNSLVDIADALGDQLYILCGTILKHGMQNIIEEVFDEIHQSNMSKLGEDGLPILRNDGKILKGSGYFKPDINKFIEYKKEGEQ
jgi:predicted HAD superfamily Cof-like phosphohydrolase